MFRMRLMTGSGVAELALRFAAESGSVRRRATMEHTRQSRPDHGLGFQIKALKTC